MGPVRVLHKLRTSRCYKQQQLLRHFDNTIRSCLSAINNTDITDVVWQQASLPVSRGGLGVRSLEKLALPAFLASAYSVANLASEITIFQSDTYCEEAQAEWCDAAQSDIPVGELKCTQKSWDEPIIRKTISDLQCLYRNDISSQARLMAVATNESGAWLKALPESSLGNLLNDSALRIAVALQLGATVSIAHQCICGERADDRGYHAMSCKRSAGRKKAHASLNSIVKRTFASAGYETDLEPPGISRTDGKRPDGVTLAPWERGKMLTWDATRRCTVALTYLPATSKKAGAAALLAEQAKVTKYQNITGEYLFCPLTFETMGPWGSEAHRLMSSLARKIRQETGEKRAKEYIYLRVSIELHRANQTCAVLVNCP